MVQFDIIKPCLLVFFFNSEVDEYGFKRDCNFDYAAYDVIMTNYYKILTKRRIKWQSLMKNPPNFHNKKSPKLKRYIRKGIPGLSFDSQAYSMLKSPETFFTLKISYLHNFFNF